MQDKKKNGLSSHLKIAKKKLLLKYDKKTQLN